MGFCKPSEGGTEACLSSDMYVGMRKNAKRLNDLGNYRLEAAEMNPAIFEEMLSLILRKGLRKRVWEPFAGTGSKRFWVMCVMGGFEIESYGLSMGSCRVLADSTRSLPSGEFGGVLMHPPYYGSDPQSESPQDLSRMSDWDEYVTALSRVFRSACRAMDVGGIMVAVGRDYRAVSRRVRLDLLYVEIMDALPMEVEEVWISEPDVAIIARKTDEL